MRRTSVIVGACAVGCALLVGCRTVRPDAAPDDDIRWLEERSLLRQAAEQARRISGHEAGWRLPYSRPQPREVVRAASAWLLHYPGSVIPEPGKSVIATWANPRFWDALADIGIDLLHTCPVKRSGGVGARGAYTPTVDGWFDRISLEVDPQLGTEDEYRQMVSAAAARGALVAGDLVPLHTGMGPDFRLAERAYKDYPGVYTMVEVRREDWPLLPAVADRWATALVPREAAVELTRKGYIPGLVQSADAHPEAKTWSGWSATAEVAGVDGRVRRWLFLHVFKPQQPALNWADPSYAARRLAAGDAIHSLRSLGDRIVRLDAVPFLGIERQSGTTMARSFMHPLSVLGTDDLAFLVRRLGGWSFQELNVPLADYKVFARQGPDLGYDFFTRAQVLYALLSGDAGPLRLAHRLLLEEGVPAGTLIHDMQNHDEITFQLVELDARAEQALAVGGGRTVSGAALKRRILDELAAKAAGSAAPWNRLYRPERDGLATTFAGFIAPAVGVRDPYRATPDELRRIQDAHLLLAHANAMQPGVFGISSWDLVGALPLPESAVADRTRDGDYRWINRGAVDLQDGDPRAARSPFGLPRAHALYGSLPAQLRSPGSFVSRLKRMLAARKRHRLAEAEIVAVPEITERASPTPGALAALVMKLPDSDAVAVTVLNYGRAASSLDIDLGARFAGRAARDIVADEEAATVSGAGRLTIAIAPLAGRTLVVVVPPAGGGR